MSHPAQPPAAGVGQVLRLSRLPPGPRVGGDFRPPRDAGGAPARGGGYRQLKFTGLAAPATDAARHAEAGALIRAVATALVRELAWAR